MPGQKPSGPMAATAAGGRAIRGAVSTIAQHGTPADNKGTRLVGGQDNGELSNVSQKYGTTPGTASVVFPRLGYAMTCGANIKTIGFDDQNPPNIDTWSTKITPTKIIFLQNTF